MEIGRSSLISLMRSRAFKFVSPSFVINRPINISECDVILVGLVTIFMDPLMENSNSSSLLKLVSDNVFILKSPPSTTISSSFLNIKKDSKNSRSDGISPYRRRCYTKRRVSSSAGTLITS